MPVPDQGNRRMDLRDLHGRPFALLLKGEADDGTPDWCVFGGIAHWDGLELRVDRREPNAPFIIPPDWWPRIRATNEKTRAILLDADYTLSLTVESLPVDADVAAYLATGLRWPRPAAE